MASFSASSVDRSSTAVSMTSCASAKSASDSSFSMKPRLRMSETWGRRPGVSDTMGTTTPGGRESPAIANDAVFDEAETAFRRESGCSSSKCSTSLAPRSSIRTTSPSSARNTSSSSTPASRAILRVVEQLSPLAVDWDERLRLHDLERPCRGLRRFRGRRRALGHRPGCTTFAPRRKSLLTTRLIGALVSGDDPGAQDHAITGLEADVAVRVVRDLGERRQLLALASGGDDELLSRVGTFSRSSWTTETPSRARACSRVDRGVDVLDHAAPDERDFAPELARRRRSRSECDACST